MSTIKAKDHVAEITNTSPNDWKRISKKGSGRFCYRQFENINTNEKILVSCDDTYDLYYICETKYIPDSFCIVLPANMPKTNVDKSLVLINSDPMGFDGDPDGIEVVFFNSSNKNGIDQHCSHLVEWWLGIKDFSKYFEETCENSNMLIRNLSIQDVIDLLQNKGLKFLGFEEYYDFH